MNSAPITVRYRGVRRRGADCVSGIASARSVAEFAKSLFDKGWATAQIFDEDGREVGGVTASLDRQRKRTWWGES